MAVRFPGRSVERYDRGHEWEAARIAICLRILFHDAKGSKSLVGQVGLKAAWRFVDTGRLKGEARPPMPHGILVTEWPVGGTTRYRAPVQMHAKDQDQRVPFAEWWGGEVFRLGPSFNDWTYTREQIVLGTANADGGAHVDPKLRADFYQLARTAGAIGSSASLERTIRHPIWELLRQLAYETQLTAHESMPDLAPAPRHRPSAMWPALIVTRVSAGSSENKPDHR